MFTLNTYTKQDLPIVAIANYGPDEMLENNIRGIKDGLAQQGFKENEHVRFEIGNANFELTLIEQMLTKLKAHQPAVMVVMTTPVAQNAKNLIKDIPLVYSVITDPLLAGLLLSPNQSYQNMTGSSDKQNLGLFLAFAKKILPQSKTVGLLYSNSEANDAAVLEMMQEACKETGFTLLPIAIDHPRDIPFRMQAFKNKVDFIYLGGSSLMQPAIPAIAACADKMHIPLFNVHEDPVKHHFMLGSFGVNYYKVGVNAGNLVARVLKGENMAQINPVYPQEADHVGFISKQRAEQLQIVLSPSLEQVTIVD